MERRASARQLFGFAELDMKEKKPQRAPSRPRAPKAPKAGNKPARVAPAAASEAQPEAPAVGSDYFAQKTRAWYTPFPRQREFHDCGAKYRLFGGAAGPGKTKALLMEAIRQANTYPKIDTLLMRRTFPELEKSLLTYFRRDVPREAYKSYNDSKHIVTWHNGSTTHFGYSAFEHDIYQYQGAEFFFIGIDELTHFTLGQWQFLTSRNRSACKDAEPNMAGASNPGNIGHAWVKALWVDRRAPGGMEEPERYDPYDYAFIRATLDDNPIYRNDAGYRKTLEALPRHLRQAFLYGDWNVYAGQYFDIFDVRVHTARAEELGLEPWWPRWISVDWGFEHPSAVYWHAARPDGAVITYREFVANHLSPRMLAQAIAERSVSWPCARSEFAYRSGSTVGSGGQAGAAPLTGFVKGAGFDFRSERSVSAREGSTYRGSSPRAENPHVSQTETWGTQNRASGALGDGDGFSSTGIPACAPYADEALPPGSGAGYPPLAGTPSGAASFASKGAGFATPSYRDPGRGTSPGPERIGEIYLSPDAFARRTSESTIAEQLGDVLAQNGLPRPAPADDDRVGGWMMIYQLLEQQRWIIAENCERLIECLPTLTRDPANIEDVLKATGDDPADSARYGLKSRLAPGRAPLEQRAAERITAVDPTSRAIWMQRFAADERRATRPAPIPRRNWWGTRS